MAVNHSTAFASYASTRGDGPVPFHPLVPAIHMLDASTQRQAFGRLAPPTLRMNRRRRKSCRWSAHWAKPHSEAAASSSRSVFPAMAFQTHGLDLDPYPQEVQRAPCRRAFDEQRARVGAL